MDWFRSWHGAPTDPKWLLIAKRSETQAGVVSAIVWALFDYASQNSDDRGCVDRFDAETYAAFSGFEEPTIKRVIECLKEKKLIIDGHLAAWEKRQTKREDNSTPRVQKHRNAKKRNETLGNDREEKSRPEEKKKDEGGEGSARAPVAAPTRGKSLISEEAFAVSTEVLAAMGLDPHHPLSVGSPLTVQGWFNIGLHRDCILSGVRTCMEARGRDPPGTLKYFEKAILRAQAELTRPPPIVVTREAETITVTNHAATKSPRNGSSILASIDRELAIIERQEEADFAMSEDAVFLLPQRSV
jgi:hypothetical protein